MYYILFNLCSVFQFHWWPFLLRLAQRLLYFFYESIKSCLIRIRFFWYFLVCFISKLLRMKTITHDDPSSTFQTDYHSKEQLLFYVWIEILFCFDYLKIPTNSFLWVWNNRENMLYLIIFFLILSYFLRTISYASYWECSALVHLPAERVYLVLADQFLYVFSIFRCFIPFSSPRANPILQVCF